MEGNKKPRSLGGASGSGSVLLSGGKGLTGALDHRLQRLGAGVLIRVKTFSVTCDTVFVDDREAEAAFASGHDQAVHRCEGIGKRMNGMLSLSCMSHQGVS